MGSLHRLAILDSYYTDDGTTPLAVRYIRDVERWNANGEAVTLATADNRTQKAVQREREVMTCEL